MIVDSRNLQIQLTRGRAQTMAARFGTWLATPPPPGCSDTRWTWLPTDISTWWFSFTMRTNFTRQQSVVALTKNPIQNEADATQGQLLWTILDTDTEMLATGNYVFDMSITVTDVMPRFFCGGVVALFDNVTDPVTTPI